MNNWKRKVFPYVLVMPTVLLFCTYIFYPALSGFVYSFQKWDGIGPMKYKLSVWMSSFIWIFPVSS